MNLTTYQKTAHSTTCPGISFAFSLLSLGKTAGEVSATFGSYVAPCHQENTKFWELTRTKLKDKLGDVMWAVAEIATLSQMGLEDVFINHVEEIDSDRPQCKLFDDVKGLEWVDNALSSYDTASIIHAFPAVAGRVSGLFAKFMLDHGGRIPVPENEQQWLFPQECEEDLVEFYEDVFTWLGRVLLLVYRLTRVVDIDFDEILQMNLDKLAASKKPPSAE